MFTAIWRTVLAGAIILDPGYVRLGSGGKASAAG